jgi:hypothetical protein
MALKTAIPIKTFKGTPVHSAQQKSHPRRRMASKKC